MKKVLTMLLISVVFIGYCLGSSSRFNQTIYDNCLSQQLSNARKIAGAYGYGFSSSALEGLQNLEEQARIDCLDQANNWVDLDNHKYYFTLGEDAFRQEDYTTAISYFQQSLFFLPPQNQFYISTLALIQRAKEILYHEEEIQRIEKAKEEALNAEKNRMLNDRFDTQKEAQRLDQQREKEFSTAVQEFKDRAQELQEQEKKKKDHLLDHFYDYLDRGDDQMDLGEYESALSYFQDAKSIAYDLDSSYQDKINNRIMDAKNNIQQKKIQSETNQALALVTNKFSKTTMAKIQYKSYLQQELKNKIHILDEIISIVKNKPLATYNLIINYAKSFSNSSNRSTALLGEYLLLNL